MKSLGRAFLAIACGASACRWGGPPTGEPNAAPPAPAEAVTPRASRVLYPAAPVSFVDIVREARGAVVSIRSATPVKSVGG